MTSLLQQQRSSSPSNGRSGEGGTTTTYAITEECERLFCDTLRVIFLGEGDVAGRESGQGSVVMGANCNNNNDVGAKSLAVQSPGAGDGGGMPSAAVNDWLELWDYVGGTHLRGFVAEHADEKSLFVFFEPDVIRHNLKPAYVFHLTILLVLGSSLLLTGIYSDSWHC